MNESAKDHALREAYAALHHALMATKADLAHRPPANAYELRCDLIEEINTALGLIEELDKTSTAALIERAKASAANAQASALTTQR